MLLNFFETNPIPFENKINWRFKNIKYFSIISNKESIDKKFVLYSNFLKSEYKKYELIKLILLKRNNSILSIQRNIKKYLIRKQMKTYYIIQEIILKRENSALMIEKHFRSFLIRKHFKYPIIPDSLNFAKNLVNIYLRNPNCRKLLRIEISKTISFFSKNQFCEWVMELFGYNIDLCY